MLAQRATFQSLGDGIWALEGALRQGPIHFPLRMTVLQQQDGRLVLWSPVALSDDAKSQLATLGEVATIVAPNAFHHLFLPAAVAAYPHAKVVGVPGHHKKRPDVCFDLIVDPATTQSALTDVGLGGNLEVLAIAGCPMVNELVAIHAPSQTAVFTDTVYNIHRSPNTFSRWFWKLDGVWQRAALPRTTPFFARDRAAFRNSLLQVVGRPWEQLVMAHGDVVPHNGKQPFVDWLARNGGMPAQLPA